MADKVKLVLPKVETEKKIGNTTYIVTGIFAPEGITISDTIKRLLDRESRN